MSWLHRLFLRRRLYGELSEEIREHLEEKVEELVARGMSREEARYVARREFGNVTLFEEDGRGVWRWAWAENILMDLRYGLRMLRKSRGFTVVAVLTLAIGIAANTAVFTAFDAVFLRPRATADPERLARVYRSTRSNAYGALSYPDYLFFREHSRSFSDVFLLSYGMGVTSSDFSTIEATSGPGIAGALGFKLPQLLPGSARPIGCGFVSGNYFAALGARPMLGRLLAPADDQRGAPPVVMLSGNFWQRQFRSNPTIVGSILHLNGVAFTVIGVTPMDYLGIADTVPEVWVPVNAKLQLGTPPEEFTDRKTTSGWVEGRLRPGVTLADAEAELNVLMTELRAADPKFETDSAMRVISGKTYAQPLDPQSWALVAVTMSAVGLLLLIACCNVASLLLARAAARQREIALRISLGAGRIRLLQQLLTESSLIALLAGAAGLPLAWWMLRILVLQIAASLPSFWGSIALQIDPDKRVLAYTVGISLLTGVVFGLTPALQSVKKDLNSGLKNEGNVFGRRIRRSWLRGGLIAGEIAAALVLLVCSVLLLRGSQRGLTIDPGFDNNNVIFMEVQEPPANVLRRNTPEQLTQELATAMRNVRGVTAVSRASRGPLAAGNRFVAAAPARTKTLTGGPSESETPDAGYSFIDSDYFQTLSIPFVRGRDFTRDEVEGNARVAIVSEALARRFWPGEDPIGKLLRVGTPQPAMSFPGEYAPYISSTQVIGVVRDVRSLGLREVDGPYIYLPLDRSRWNSVLLVRAEKNPAALLPALGQEVRRLDANLPVIAGVLRTMISFDAYFVISRIGGVLASIVGILGLLLACMGVYGTVGYAVVQRTQEIGIRMALGADRRSVVSLILRDGLRPMAFGIIAGLLAAAGVSRVLSSFLFGLSSLDVTSFGGVSVVLVGVALFASYMPARRAMRVDPMVALRYE
jgi:macrolide transport system ATP-binding/permease protein